MATGLDVWVARQGSACQVDDRAWNVTVFDAHNKVFQWGGVAYANLPAPHAHWAGSIPPGTYVVQAVSVDKKLTTEHAIVTVECVQVACVRLYVAPSGSVGDPGHTPPEGRCRIAILEVVGIGDAVPSIIRVTGTALKCKKVKVTVSCGSRETRKTETSVQANGHWTADIKTEDLGCRCGKPVTVIARCVEDPECVSKFETDKLRCRPSHTDDVPK